MLKDLLSKRIQPSGLLKMASGFGLLPPMADLFLSSLNNAPSPRGGQLSDDWLKNLDVLADSVGCMGASFFDHFVEGTPPDVLKSLTRADFEQALNGVPMAGILLPAFEVMKNIYLQHGPLCPLICQGKLSADSLVAQSMVQGFAGNTPLAETQSMGQSSHLVNILDKSRELSSRVI